MRRIKVGRELGRPWLIVLFVAVMAQGGMTFSVSPLSWTPLLPLSGSAVFLRRVVARPGSCGPLFNRKIEKLTKRRKEQLGVSDDEDEYDLGRALEVSTDPLITKIVAGSFIAVVIGLLVAGIVIPSLTDYGEGVCNPLLTQGRC